MQPDQLGKFLENHDIVCNFSREYDMPVEIKKLKTPNWMQMKIYFSESEN